MEEQKMENIHLNYNEMLNILSALTYTYLYGHLTKEDAMDLKHIIDKLMAMKLSSSEHFNLEEII